MASDKIKYDDLFASDINKQLKELETGLKSVLETQREIIKTGSKGGKTAENIEKTNAALRESKTARQGLTDVQKTQQKLNELETKEGKELLALKTKLTKKRRESKQAIEGENSAYKKLTNSTNKAQANLKNLAAQYGVNSKQAKKASVEFNKLDKQLRKVNNTAKDGRRDVGRYGKAFGGLKGVIGGLGITAGIAGFVRVMGNAIKTAKDFEQGNANLASVLGTTKENITVLTDDAKRLGAATSFSATQVSELQTEFAKLGFNEAEILNATEATLDLAAATGAELGEAAAIAGATLGGFGLDASETGRVADVMAKSFSTSALDLEKFKESMKGAAPAAKAVGISVEETTALLGTLANAGISGSKAGNNLKTSFINLNAAGLTLEEGLEKVANSEDKLGTAAKLVGKNAAASFLVLSDGVDVTKELTKGLNNAGGAAKKMANEQLNTLSGKTKILASAWEGLVLSLLSGDGAFSNISKGLVDMATNLLGVLTPAAELESTWYAQRDAVEDLETGLSPLLDRYDELTEKTELTKEEQIELDSIIQQVAETVPTAITEFDKYGKALDISTSAAKKFIQQQKDLLALDNVEAIEEQQDAIKSLNNSLRTLNNTYEVQDGKLKKVKQNYKSGIISFVDATAKEIKAFQAQGANIKKEIELRNAKIAKLRGEKTAAEEAADAEAGANSVTEKNITTLNTLNAELSELKKLRGDIDVLDRRELRNNKSLIKAKQKEIDLINGKVKASKKEKKEKEKKLERTKVDPELIGLNKFLQDKEKLENEYLDKTLDDKTKEVNDVEDKYFTLLESAEKFGEDAAILEEARQKELDDIDDKYSKIQADRKRKEDEAAQKLIDDELKRQREKRDALIDLAKEVTGELSNALDERFDDRNKDNEKEIDEREKSIETHQELAEKGIDNQLAFEERKLVEANLKEKQELEKQAQIKEGILLAEAYLVAYQARLKDDPDTAGFRALSDVLLAKGIAQTLVSAFAGYEEGGYTGEYGTSEIAGVVHGKEFVIDAATTKQMGLKGSSMGDFKNKMFSGQLFNHDFITSDMSKAQAYDNTRVVNAVESLENTIKSQPIQQVNVDGLGNLLEIVYKDGIKTVTTHKNKSRRL